MKVEVNSLKGEGGDQVYLPAVFKASVRPDLIKKAVLSAQSSRKQPKGSKPKAGMETSAETPPKGSGQTRVRRVKGSGYHAGGRGAWAPFTRGGREAHPPKSEAEPGEEMNKKEKHLAILSAIPATKEKEWVADRGHEVEDVDDFPIVVEDDFQELKKTREVKEVLEELGVWKDVERVKSGRKIRAGRGKSRGRTYKNKVGPLSVVAEDSGIFRGARNIPGVDIVLAEQLNAEMLAPGGVPGRLTVWTESALEEIDRGFSE